MDPPAAQPTTRLAPSPTGALHLGNARTFLINWALARQRGWRVTLRIEDLDTPRVKPGVIEQTIDILRWLGMDWDDGPTIQSDRLRAHADAMSTLSSAGMVYPCALSRTEIEQAASAPQEGTHETIFPVELRPDTIPRIFDNPNTNWRFIAGETQIAFNDHFAGPQSFDPAQAFGDFVVWTKRAQPSYQLAVVLDDAHAGVTHIVRGDDLLDSAARQLLLYRALGLGPEPACFHLPLVRGQDGRRLAKRHGDTRLITYRDRGVPPERIIGLCGHWCGLCAQPEPMSPAEFRAALTLDTIPKVDIVFKLEDESWLMG